MEKKLVIYDLDDTIITRDYNLERELFNNLYKEQAYLIINHLSDYINEYENTHIRRSIGSFSRFLSYKTTLNVTKKHILEWIYLPYQLNDKIEDGIKEVLDFTKSNGGSNAISSNWFWTTQINRLKASGLLEYIDDIYTGDMALKPHREMYYLAMNKYPPNDCLFVGDSVEKDYIGPRIYGIESILYDKFNSYSDNIKKVKKLIELKKYF